MITIEAEIIKVSNNTETNSEAIETRDKREMILENDTENPHWRTEVQRRKGVRDRLHRAETVAVERKFHPSDTRN